MEIAARTRALGWATASAACVAALGATAAVLLAWPRGVALDVRALEALQREAPPAFALRADAFAHLAGPAAYAFWVLVLCGVAIARGRPRHVVAVVVVAVGSGITTQALKAGLAHPRGADLLAGIEVEAASWPSGHTTAAVTLALCAVLVSPRALRPLVAVLALAGAAVVGAATVVAGWHLPSDVAGGTFVAAAWVAAAAAVLAGTAPQRTAVEPRRSPVRPRPRYEAR